MIFCNNRRFNRDHCFHTIHSTLPSRDTESRLPFCVYCLSSSSTPPLVGIRTSCVRSSLRVSPVQVGGVSACHIVSYEWEHVCAYWGSLCVVNLFLLCLLALFMNLGFRVQGSGFRVYGLELRAILSSSLSPCKWVLCLLSLLTYLCIRQ